jgi:hypothetical protein
LVLAAYPIASVVGSVGCAFAADGDDTVVCPVAFVWSLAWATWVAVVSQSRWDGAGVVEADGRHVRAICVVCAPAARLAQHAGDTASSIGAIGLAVGAEFSVMVAWKTERDRVLAGQPIAHQFTRAVAIGEVKRSIPGLAPSST